MRELALRREGSAWREGLSLGGRRWRPQGVVGEGDSKAVPGTPDVCVELQGPFRSAHNSSLVFSFVSRTNLSLGVPKKAREDPLPVPSDQHSLPFL